MSEQRSTNGLDLSESYYRETVKPLLQSHFPAMQVSAGLLGDGSEVLGFDTEMSQDHDWGPRVMLFLSDSDYAKSGKQVALMLQQELPKSFHGFVTHFATPNQIAELRSENQSIDNHPANTASTVNTVNTTSTTNTVSTVSHSVEVLTAQKFIWQHINFELSERIKPADWLTFPEQKLATIVGGRLFEDGIGVQAIRDRFAYYPKDVWLYLLACQWTRIEQEEHLMGRAGYAGDELGSAIIGARLVRDLMRLCFLMEKQYAPYPKWFGTAFACLKSAKTLAPLLRQILASSTWEERQEWLSEAYEFVAAAHNELRITENLPTSVRQFHGRPFFVISMGEFSKAIFSQIQDQTVRKISEKRPIGSIDQFSDSTDLISDPAWRSTLKSLYV
ncbi:MAG: DUF4037 domain-containing protein [Candidatus Melainabacteria bacterium]|nr:DUF4037 domain-containing protein [Candidatus Melainabacteria bacterium]